MAATKRRKLANREMAKGPKKTQRFGFKATEAMRLFVERRSDVLHISYSELMRRCAELYKDIFENLGNEFHEVERRASINSQSIGEAMAGLVKTTLEQEKKLRK